jgi:group II intron reverse transcriptase/maturase
MADAPTTANMSPELRKVAELAKRDPDLRFRTLAHLIDEAALLRAFERLRKDAAIGVDGVTRDEYAKDLEPRLRDLHERLRTKRYRHQPIRRVHIPKAPGKTRPIGVSCIEDKIVQGALRELLEAIYEQDFLPCSFGFRPARSAHDALRELNRILWASEAGWVLEADIESFFDSIDREMLKEILRRRIADESFLRLVGKCLHVGVLDGEEYSEPDEGTVQGSILSPLLGNIYLHHVLDVWFEEEVKPRLRGRAALIRYADDFVVCFERKDDAERVLEVIGQRMQKFGLRLHPEKTRLFPFRKPPRDSAAKKGPTTFDFLGFTLFWRRSHTGAWALGMKTRRARLARAFMAVADWCRRHRHLTVEDQHAALCRRLNGHFNYFGVNGNVSSLERLLQWARGTWRKWLNRRGQRASMKWERFDRVMKRFPFPRAFVRVQIWLTAS